MNKTALIFRHEFQQTVTRKLFVIMTLALPLLALLAIGIYQIVAATSRPPAADAEMTFGYVDEAGGFDSFTDQEGITFIPFGTLDSATKALVNGDIAEYFVIPADYVTAGMVSRYTLNRELAVPDRVQLAVKSFLINNLLKDRIAPDITNRVKEPVLLVSTRLTMTGEIATEQGGPAALMVPYIFSVLLMVSIFFSSGYLLEGLGEEKENRVMEILLSSVSARQLLVGKVLGLGAGGLIQILVWLISAPLLLRMASATIGGFMISLQIPPDFIILGITYFILGYSLFAVLMAGIGAISPTSREAQQLVPIFSIAAISPFWFLSFIAINPNHPVATAFTIFPITAPVTVMARLGIADIPAWELSVSIALLVVSVVGGLLLAAKIFRTYLLMYGKRPGLREIIHTLRRT